MCPPSFPLVLPLLVRAMFWRVLLLGQLICHATITWLMGPMDSMITSGVITNAMVA